MEFIANKAIEFDDKTTKRGIIIYKSEL